MIDPKRLAFDIDGVFADTMQLFIEIARREFGIRHIRKEDIRSYFLEECVDIDKKIMETIIMKLIDGEYTIPLNPIDGACDVLTRLGQNSGSLLFVTARPYAGPIHEWITTHLSQVDAQRIELVTTGAFDAKADVLLQKNISFFVEDRLETCFVLHDVGITPILFRQPWNRKEHPFIEVDSWEEIEALIDYNAT